MRLSISLRMLRPEESFKRDAGSCGGGASASAASLRGELRSAGRPAICAAPTPAASDRTKPLTFSHLTHLVHLKAHESKGCALAVVDTGTTGYLYRMKTKSLGSRYNYTLQL
eukprot:2477824-Pyramimonas_sp.AAC.1